MPSRFLSFILVTLIVMTVNAEPLRRRRQSQANVQSTSPIPCPVQCSWSFSQAWAKAISFETPTPNMIPQGFITDKNDTFSVMCGLYLANRFCLQGCATNGEKSSVDAYRASPGFDQVCTNQQAAFDNNTRCLTTNTQLFQRSCQNDNSELLAASIRLITQAKSDPKVVRQFCTAANDQLFCIYPILRQTCGDAPYNLIRSIMSASMASVRKSIGDEVIEAFYPECSTYFSNIDTGISADPHSNSAVTDSSTALYNYTTSMRMIDLGNNTTAISSNYTNSTTPRGRLGKGGRLAGSRIPISTTASSAGNAIRFRNTFAIFLTVSTLFCIFW